MEVILKEDVKHLGSAYQVVKVKDGYGRNYLLPRGLALLASVSNRKVLAENMKQKAFKLEKIRLAALSVAEKLQKSIFQVGAKVGENDRIYGSVNNIQVAEAIKKTLGVDIDRKSITLDEDHIKSLGQYKAQVKLHKDVSLEITFEVVAE